MFKINSLAFVKTQGFVHKNKTLNLRPKMSYLGVFKLKFEKKQKKKLLFHLKAALSNLSYCKNLCKTITFKI